MLAREQHADEMRQAASGRRRVRRLRRIRLDPRDELRSTSWRRSAGPTANANWNVAPSADRREVLQRVVADRLQRMRHHRHRADRHHHDRRAVGCARLDRIGGDPSGRARPVFDDHRLADRVLELIRDDARDEITRSRRRQSRRGCAPGLSIRSWSDGGLRRSRRAAVHTARESPNASRIESSSDAPSRLSVPPPSPARRRTRIYAKAATAQDRSETYWRERLHHAIILGWWLPSGGCLGQCPTTPEFRHQERFMNSRLLIVLTALRRRDAAAACGRIPASRRRRQEGREARPPTRRRKPRRRPPKPRRKPRRKRPTRRRKPQPRPPTQRRKPRLKAADAAKH